MKTWKRPEKKRRAIRRFAAGQAAEYQMAALAYWTVVGFNTVNEY